MTTLPNNSLVHRKETIMMIAEEVFAQYSFSGATIRLITKRLGVNSAMISYYLGSKEALCFDIFKLRLDEITEEISRYYLMSMVILEDHYEFEKKSHV
jgi:AcrR family transcriptional regulator